MTIVQLNTHHSTSEHQINSAYELARTRYADLGVDVELAMQNLEKLAITIHCWQGDDVVGFEHHATGPDGGIQATGNYPGKATNPDQLRADLDAALQLIPGTHRLNLHAIYAETDGKPVERDELEPAHFARWIDWAKSRNMGLDFNGTFFAHHLAIDGFTLSHPDKQIRQFWIDHASACRRIAAHMGRQLGTPSVANIWIPDGYKDIPFNRYAPRQRLKMALDQIFAEHISPDVLLDAVESKLFGIGSESYVVGSHEFYMGYAMANNKLLCLDAGHFHPTEVISDKLSACLLYVDQLLLHVSRGVRWDSDHVVLLDDELRELACQIVRGQAVDRVRIGLDFFDASINRIAAWVIGTRAMLQAMLYALLEPAELLTRIENQNDYTQRLAIFESLKTLPFGAVWDMYCLKQNTPVGLNWLNNVRQYETDVLKQRTGTGKSFPT